MWDEHVNKTSDVKIEEDVKVTTARVLLRIRTRERVAAPTPTEEVGRKGGGRITIEILEQCFEDFAFRPTVYRVLLRPFLYQSFWSVD
ncbi:hypothetical protein SUGI_0092940 [Cryptomeria japonica]|nr:hypothetical protein SUGI_0092940 [Cryptomeria japonica]